MPDTTISVPPSYETLPTTHINLSHHPPGTPTTTPIVIVTLNRPEKRNAFTPAMGEDLHRVFTLFDVDHRVKAIVLTGAGDTFCVGADLEIGRGEETGRRVSEHDVALAIHHCRKPTIAAIQGSAVGIGLTLTLPATIRIAHQTSKYGLVFARRGVTMESGSSYFLPRLIGYSRAMYLVSTGGVFPGTASHFDGLFAETLAEQEAVLPRALELAADMVEHVSVLASAVNRALMWRGPRTVEESYALEGEVFGGFIGSSDHIEGVNALLEKRKPNFNSTVDDAPAVYQYWSDANVDNVKIAKKFSKL
ncbi:enoyl-CoA hydratase/isomerase family protein [Aspergillus candidus]|uniref:Enoyl-CoA hydratase/carnithine racemase n=1 Tax=Aspergillus candidus TaxID=41067 RepID=A0A2I2FLS0_ASPCN|nr:enoyl-CoA hydratase/carnithine racemase [Aspergillus candidus]PLB41576.1 enoyl-CoA hydratase/carnithine racemase [Aspergillus candidus]